MHWILNKSDDGDRGKRAIFDSLLTGTQMDFQ